jgi:hypothetical protein
LFFKKTDWPAEETESAAQTASGNGTTEHLWEESWDDDDTSDDFSAQLRYVFFSLCLRSSPFAALHMPPLSLSRTYTRAKAIFLILTSASPDSEELKKVEASKRR